MPVRFEKVVVGLFHLSEEAVKVSLVLVGPDFAFAVDDSKMNPGGIGKAHANVSE